MCRINQAPTCNETTYYHYLVTPVGTGTQAPLAGRPLKSIPSDPCFSTSSCRTISACPLLVPLVESYREGLLLNFETMHNYIQNLVSPKDTYKVFCVFEYTIWFDFFKIIYD